jgi:CRISPR/Cas system-associated exonuclease Cas4 (RecB family)
MIEVQKIITKALERNNEEHKKTRTLGQYYPSESWSCIRQKWFRFQGFEEEKSLPLGVFEMGRRAEDAFFDLLKLHYSEQRVKNNIRVVIKVNDYEICGETDPVLFDNNDLSKIQTIFEVKSQASIVLTNEPHENHIRQLMCYLKGLGVTEGYIVYICRADVSDIKSYKVSYDDKIWEGIVEHFDMFHDYLMSRTLPPAQPMMPKWECRYCPFTQRCIEATKKAC